MKRRIGLLLGIFVFFVFFFLIQKIAFAFICLPRGMSLSLDDIQSILYHGLPLDLSMSAYLTLIPALLILASIWVRGDAICKVFNVYFLIVLILLTVIGVLDIMLYSYWGYHFNSTLLGLLKTPKEALVGVSFIGLSVALLVMVFVSVLLYIIYKSLFTASIKKLDLPLSVGKTLFILSILTIALIIPIRGDQNYPTTSVEKAYFSDNTYHNHATINPQLNFAFSFFNTENK